MRIAVLNKDRCKPNLCNHLCTRMCPKVRSGDETIVKGEDGKPAISEELCTGCGICVTKCPFAAIHIINLPEEIGEPVHQYGKNGFRIYNLPTPKKGVVGIIGSNGIGKTTALKILSGGLKPNLGGGGQWPEIIERFKGSEIHGYLEKIHAGQMRAVYKPQYVDGIPKVLKGTVRSVLEKGDERGVLGDLVRVLNLTNSVDKDIKELSGGELQRVAMAACLSKEADMYLIDEPSSYLDVGERLNMANAIRSLEDKYVFVVEHDLVVLDYLSDYIHVIYGKPAAYGIISGIKGVRVGINEYLSGFLKAENVRFRGEIKFDIRAPKEMSDRKKLMEYPLLKKDFKAFTLKADPGTIHSSEVLGILGANATGKTTFVRMLAGVFEPDNTKLDLDIKVSYKPQYIEKPDKRVSELSIREVFKKGMNIQHLMENNISDLSGGELQRVAIAECLSKKADIYLLDEPSAYLDVEERLHISKVLRGFADESESGILVVDHDILVVDYLSDSLLVFEGDPGKTGHATKPTSLKDGMNQFLKGMGITFRRDPETGRPRANKSGSVKDREQKASGDYYYLG